MTDTAALAMRVWSALDPSTPATTGELAARLAEDAERVNYAISSMVRTLRAVRAGGGFIRGAAAPGARKHVAKLTAHQLQALERCSSVYGGTLASIGAVTGLSPRRAAAVAQNLRRRGLLDMSGTRFAARYWTTDAGYELGAPE